MSTPPRGVPQEIWDEPVTGVHEGAELAALRARRPTHERLSILERKSDEHREALHAVEKAVERVCGKLETYIETVQSERREAHATERTRSESRARIWVALFTAVGAIGGALAAVLAGCT